MWENLKRKLIASPEPSVKCLNDNVMLKFFLSQLDVRARFIESLKENDPEKQKLLREVQEGLQNFFDDLSRIKTTCWDDVAWNHAYRLERLLALIEPLNTLEAEVSRRLRAVQRCAAAGVSLWRHRSGQNGAGGRMAGFPDRQTSDS